MKKPFLSIITISMLMVSIIAGIMDFSPSASGEQGPPNDSGLGMDVTSGDDIWTTNGTWTIESGDNIIHSNKTIIVNGDLQINGTLTLINVTLQMDNATYDGQYNITVYDAGNLLISDLDDDNSTTADASVIESATAFRYGFQVTPGAQFKLKNSELYDCGWDNPWVQGYGLFINTDWARITGNFINYTFWGITIWESNNVTFENNTIVGPQEKGIYAQDSEYCYIRNNTITNVPARGLFLNSSIYLRSCIFFNISSNNIINSPDASGISILGGGGHDVYNNKIDNNDWGVLIYADGASYTTTFCYIFANDISNNNRGIFIQGFDATSAVRDIYIFDNQIYSNSEYAIFIYGDWGPFAVNNIYIFRNEIFDNIDTFGGHAVRFYANTFFSDVGIIYCYDNVIRDNSFSSSAGYHMRAVTNVFIWDEQLLRNKRNLWIDSSENVQVINSTLEKSTLALTLDAQIENKSGRGSSVYFLNTTFSPPFANVEDADSFLDVRRYLHVRVIRLGLGADNANVWINDSFNNPDPDLPQPLSTGVGNDGWIRWLVVSEINKTSSQTTTYTPHHIDARDGSTFGWADPTMDASKEVVISLDSPPNVEDFSISDTSVLRTNQIFIYANGSDIEDSEEFLTPIPQYKETSGSIWDNTYFGLPTYMGSAPSGYWQIPFIPSKTAPLGDYDFRIQFEDNASYFSDWFYYGSTVLVMNNLPYVEQPNNESSSVKRGQTIEIWVDGEDIEEGDDQNFSNANAAEYEYRANGSGLWEAIYFSAEYKDGTDWRASFTPEATPSKALLGPYDFRFRYLDNDNDWSTWFVKDDWIDVLNSPTSFIDLTPGKLDMFRGDSIWIFANGTDAEDPESNLIVEFYYDEPGGGQVWEQAYLNNLLWDSLGFWKIQFSLPGNAPLGWYDFKIRFTDSDSGNNETIVNGLVNVINSLPVPIDINPSSPTVSKGVGSIFINVNAMDYEDAEDLLTIEVEYQLNNSGNWQSAYIGPQSYAGSPPSGNLRVTFQPDSGAALGFYDFRVRVIDTDLATSTNPEWIYIYNAVEVLSQIYTVDYIKIRDEPDNKGNVVNTRTFGVKDTATFYAAGYNISGDYVADVDVEWLSDTPLVGSVTSSGPSTLFEAQKVASNSTCIVTATYLGSITNSTGILTILAPTIDGLEIQSATGGGGINLGDPGNYPTYPVGHTTTFYGALVNNSIGYLIDVPATATWESDNTNVVTATSPGNSSSIVCNSKNWGTVTITLTDFENNFIETTLISVSEPTIDYILITDGPDGGGTNLCDPTNYPTFPVGHVTTFYGGYYNSTAGYILDVPVSSTWVSDNESIVTTAPSGISSLIECSDFNVGTVIITVDDGISMSNTTQVTVMDVTIDYIQIRSQPGGSGLEPSMQRPTIIHKDILGTSRFLGLARIKIL
jgi:parallel beta-helix repeat protein